MSYHVKLCKAISYTGVISATQECPDVFVEDKATAQAAVATGYFVLIDDTPEKKEAQPEPAAHLDGDQLDGMKFDDVKKLAEDMGIDTKNLKKKADLIAAISAVEVTPGEEV